MPGPPGRAAHARLAARRARVLLDWFTIHRRPLPWREDRDPYRRWVAEVILQQTRVGPSIDRYRSFLARFPDVQSLARATLPEVLKAWEGAGYYARARNLHAAARRLAATVPVAWPRTATAWRTLPGVGPYIANALASRLADEPVIALDANGQRVAARWTGDRGDPRAASTRRRIARILGEGLPEGRAGDFNEAVMELGETICLPVHPACARCPVRSGCRGYARGAPERFPPRTNRRPRPVVRAAIAGIERSGRWLVHLRPPAGLLGGLWELPGGKIAPGEGPEEAIRREVREETGLTLVRLRRVGHLRHSYSHFTVDLTVFVGHGVGRLRPDGPPETYRWVTGAAFDRLARPTATVRAARLLRAPPRRDRTRPAALPGHPPEGPQTI